MKFTDKQVKNLKPKETRYVVWEENAYGLGTLGVRVSPNGKRTWIFMYRYDGKSRMLTLGVYPKVSVAEAHAAHGNHLKLLEIGEDPGAKEVARRIAVRKGLTINELADLYLDKWAKPKKKSWKEDERILAHDIRPVWGKRKARNIVRRDVVALLDDIVERGSPVAANRTLALVRKMFNFAISRDILQQTPCVAVSAPGKEHRRERVLSEEEIKRILEALPNSKLSKLSRLAIRFILLTAQRVNEVLSVEWNEINMDFGWWTIPAEKAKNNLAHRVPLSPQAIAVLKEAQELSTSKKYVFPSPRGKKSKPMVPTVLARGVRRSDDEFAIEHWTPYDLRRTAASHMASMGFQRLLIGKILNHVESGVTAVYDRHSYDSEKKEALYAWGQRVAEIEARKTNLKVAEASQSRNSGADHIESVGDAE